VEISHSFTESANECGTGWSLVVRRWSFVVGEGRDRRLTPATLKSHVSKSASRVAPPSSCNEYSGCAAPEGAARYGFWFASLKRCLIRTISLKSRDGRSLPRCVGEALERIPQTSAPKGVALCERLTASLKRCPDTSRVRGAAPQAWRRPGDEGCLVAESETASTQALKRWAKIGRRSATWCKHKTVKTRAGTVGWQGRK
jgi:hypothetical protein